MMKILDSYLLRQFLTPFFLAVAAFAIIGILDYLFVLIELNVISDISFSVIMRLLLYKMPATMVIFFPMAVLFSIMLLLIRMAKDNELTVLRASGIHTGRFIVPLLCLMLASSLLSFWINEDVVPWTNRVSERLYREQITKIPPPEIAENVVFRTGGTRHFYIRHIDRARQALSDIVIMEDTTRYPRIITAQEGHWDGENWILRNGRTYSFDHQGVINFSQFFDRMVIYVNQRMGNFFSTYKSPKEMDSDELKDRIASLRQSGLNTQALEVEYYLKQSLPFACLIFGGLGLSFCLIFVRSGRDWWGVIIAICFAVLAVGFYFFLLALSRALAKDGTLTPMLGAWIPNLVYGTMAATAILFQILRR